MFIRFRHQPDKQSQDVTEQQLQQLSFLPQKDLLEQFNSHYDAAAKTPIGLSAQSASAKLGQFGKNEITVKKKQTTLDRVLASLVNPFNAVLVVVAIVSYFTDRITNGAADWLTIFIIFAMILISSIVSFTQSQRSSKAAAKLASMIKNTAAVYRDNKLLELPMSNLVVGDIIELSAGDMIPADIRLLYAKDLFVAQAALTGESTPVEKFADIDTNKQGSLTDLKNLGFMGSNVVSGTGTAIIVAAGNNTYFGSMAKTLNKHIGKNSFERGVSSVSKLLIRITIIMVPLVFLINYVLKADWSSSLLFAVSVAVGLTPEMLPVIMSSTLATGASKMAKRKVIVKQLGAIQSFGEMDILCTDKTGTLTENKIILEKYVNINGEDDQNILQYAYLNSYFQTGLKDILDVAVINRAKLNSLDKITADYASVDEIPFDFERRRLSVVLKDKDGLQRLLTKGAVEEILDISSHVKINDKVQLLTKEARAAALKTYNLYNDQGLRMLAVAEKHFTNHSGEFSPKDETDLTLIGFIGFLDPPKTTAQAAVADLKAAGIKTVILTGDSLGVATYICSQVGINPAGALTGHDIELMSDGALRVALKNCELLAKLSPAQKERVVRILQESGHTVGYMGDGINDAPPLHQADIGISVDSAVDIAKETASIILLKKDLTVLSNGVIEGRRTFSNVSKYIKLSVSSNFGNMFSVVIASFVLPFLPMLPIQILAQNLLSDLSQLGLPFDNVDKEYLQKPRKWSPKSITTAMLLLGPVSSIFDCLCFAALWFIFGFNNTAAAPFFWAGWFIFGTMSQILVVLVARTSKIPFIQSRPSLPLVISSSFVVAVAAVVAFSPLARTLQMSALPLTFIPFLVGIIILYFLTVQAVKYIYIRIFHDWL
ncbi:magnesium-translocating P-type ATPase [Candidatus Saccharibacteria bacterium]|nr:magnesium-translocating P-type ATPase [Candidatus Saccharibacteria bacterium]